MVDHTNGMDVVFNWGKFSFSDPDFAWQFYRGSLRYSMGVRTFVQEVAYQEEDRRRIVQNSLNLTLLQKRRLMEKLAWNAAPENRDFPYQYWYRNCATIPRDYLNEILGDSIRKKWAGETAPVFFRHYVRQNLAAIPLVVSILEVLMNGNIDLPISRWDEMFLPEKLHEYLKELNAMGDDAAPSIAGKLLGEDKLILDFPESKAAFIGFLPWMSDLWLVILPMILASGFSILGLLRRPLKSRDEAIDARGDGRWIKGVGAALAYWALISGGLGSALALNWIFSGHADAWHNANLWLFWPLDFVVLPLAWQLMVHGSFEPVAQQKSSTWRLWCLRVSFLLPFGHGLGIATLLALQALDFVHQDQWVVLGCFGAAGVATLGTWLAWARRYASAQNTSLKAMIFANETKASV
ncbi:hypothetical protein E3A20_10740 [Planctomyces bekefii]|uniref:Lnb N-terminal periplasmic domain-containing protein n=1 Tax=Planctomyces bekefii TaxID=1653850 RepID=A0A5C6M9V2_9PLAN|nr:hypothetical protein E3A20_10740 [Planctomyces bekefii]